MRSVSRKKARKTKDVSAQFSEQQGALTFAEVAEKIARLSNCGMPYADFLRTALEMISQSLNSDAVEVRLKEQDGCSRGSVVRGHKREFKYEMFSCVTCKESYGEMCDLAVEPLRHLPQVNTESDLFFVTEAGSIVTGDFKGFISKFAQMKDLFCFSLCLPDTYFNSVAIVHLHIGSLRIGKFSLWNSRHNFFSREAVKEYEQFASVIGLALVNQRTQAALRERVKELSCLYSIAKVAADLDTHLSDVLGQIAKLLPSAFQYPNVAAARIIFDEQVFSTAGFDENKERISCNIVINEQPRGEVSVCYTEMKQGLEARQFLDEERDLVRAVARELVLIIERKTAGENRVRSEEQLRQTDRLVTIGQVAAGVMHELNEPLGSILGFAQLLKKTPDLPEQSRRDVEKIETSSLHAREIIRELLLFSHQTAPAKAQVNFNKVIETGLYFFQSRCAKTDIQIELSLAEHLPEVTADTSQLHQVLVNLVVNSIQAMPKGGKLTIATYADCDTVTLVVKDTGIGMSEETKKRVFLPFFTTKRIGEGTGLGLFVVHNIVASHGGRIEVESKVGVGTTFSVHLPIGKKKHSEEKAKNAVSGEKG